MLIPDESLSCIPNHSIRFTEKTSVIGFYLPPAAYKRTIDLNPLNSFLISNRKQIQNTIPKDIHSNNIMTFLPLQEIPNSDAQTTITSILSHLTPSNLSLAKKDCVNADNFHRQNLGNSITSLLRMIDKTISRDEQYTFSPDNFEVALDSLAREVHAISYIASLGEILCRYEEIAEPKPYKVYAEQRKLPELKFDHITNDVDRLLKLIFEHDEADFGAQIKRLSNEVMVMLQRSIGALRDLSYQRIVMFNFGPGYATRQSVALLLAINGIRIRMGDWLRFQALERAIEEKGEEVVKAAEKKSEDFLDEVEEVTKYSIDGKVFPTLFDKVGKIRGPKYDVGDTVYFRRPVSNDSENEERHNEMSSNRVEGCEVKDEEVKERGEEVEGRKVEEKKIGGREKVGGDDLKKET